MAARAASEPTRPSIGSASGFAELTSPFRRELLAHCYRMLGSLDDAEDAVQDAFARAWHGRATFTRHVSVRAWLYRIATNVCLDLIERRKRAPIGLDRAAVQPIPLHLLDEATPGPEARYDARESVSLAFLTALQLLSPRQRSVLILRDVLSWRAAEVAELLEMSVPAANSALNRARVTLARAYAPGARGAAGPGRSAPPSLRSLLDRYVRAWESADIPGLVALLREDARVTMPPGLEIVGRDAIAAFLAESVFDGGRRIRLEPIETNARTAYLLSSAGPTDSTPVPYSILVVDLDAGSQTVTGMTVFVEPTVIGRFT